MSKKNEIVETLSYRTDPDLITMLQTGYHCCVVNPFCSNIHTHDFYELTYCMSGSAIHCVNNQEIHITDGTLFIIRPEEPHYFKNYSDANALTICIRPDEFLSFLKIYSLDDYEYFCSPSLRTELPPHLKASSSDVYYLQNLCENIIVSATPHTAPHLKLLLGHALGMIIRQNIANDRPLPNHFRRALSQMNQLEHAKGGVREFLSLTSLSHAQLCRLTKQYLNITPHEYVNSIRMKWAYSLITNTDMSMEALAESVGFSSYSHFYKLFKENYHISPSTLRGNRNKN